MNLGHIDSLEVERGSLPGPYDVRCPSMHLDSTNPGLTAGRKQLDFIFLVDRTRYRSPGYNGTESFHRETPIDGQSEDLGGVLRFDPGTESLERLDQLRNPCPLWALTLTIGE